MLHDYQERIARFICDNRKAAILADMDLGSEVFQ